MMFLNNGWDTTEEILDLAMDNNNLKFNKLSKYLNLRKDKTLYHKQEIIREYLNWKKDLNKKFLIKILKKPLRRK
jgi:hypothetical protein